MSSSISIVNLHPSHSFTGYEPLLTTTLISKHSSHQERSTDTLQLLTFPGQPHSFPPKWKCITILPPSPNQTRKTSDCGNSQSNEKPKPSQSRTAQANMPIRCIPINTRMEAAFMSAVRSLLYEDLIASIISPGSFLNP